MLLIRRVLLARRERRWRRAKDWIGSRRSCEGLPLRGGRGWLKKGRTRRMEGRGGISRWV